MRTRAACAVSPSPPTSRPAWGRANWGWPWTRGRPPAPSGGGAGRGGRAGGGGAPTARGGGMVRGGPRPGPEGGGPACHGIDGDAVRAELPRHGPTAHKGSAGHLLIVAGSQGKTGAALLA